MTTIDLKVWEQKGIELFGADQTKHRFVCPQCGNEMSIERARSEFAAHLDVLRAGKYCVEQECVGRHIKGVGCDWAAYGLFRGPLVVRDGDRDVAAFDYAGRPFTSEAPR